MLHPIMIFWLHRTVWDAPSASSKKKLVLDYEQENYFLIDSSFEKARDCLALQKLATAVSAESKSSIVSIEN